METKCRRLSLAYQDLKDLPADVLKRWASCTTELDLSNNCISFLMDFTQLETLILDHNEITCHVKIPSLPLLKTLWLNHNHIKNLATFMATLSRSCPNLRFFSMMNNEAAPSYFNGGTLTQYLDYRQYVISQLPLLEVLDDQPISDSARLEALRIYRRQNRSLSTTVKKKKCDEKKRRSSRQSVTKLPDLPPVSDLPG